MPLLMSVGGERSMAVRAGRAPSLRQMSVSGLGRDNVAVVLQ